MAVKVAFAAGLFCVVFSMFGSSQDIPDGVVYTEVKKTLVNGTTGILRCRFKGLPSAVFWKKGSDPAKSPSMIIWSYDEKSGPRYEDGTCDIDEKYSLFIRNVRNTDAGRYICRVFNYKGILIYNYTDVMITNSAVRTEQSVAAQKGKIGVLPCQVNIRPRRVSWVRGANDTLVSMDLSRRVVERSGPGYEEGLFNITSEYSLLINDVKILHEGSYFCEVTDFDTGLLFRNVTRLNVFALPLEPFPSIEECPREQQVLLSCTLSIASETTLTCEVREYYPVIDLFFMHGSLRVDSLETTVWNNSDGTRNKRVTIATNGTSETFYECVARGLVGELVSRSKIIHLIRNDHRTRVAVAVVVPVIFISTIVVYAVNVIKRRERHLKNPISYIELWKLVQYAREQHLSDKLGRVLDTLIMDEETSQTLQTDKDFYKELCQWKAGHTGTCQREDFIDACMDAGLESAIDQLQKYSDSTRAVTVDDLEHTLWHIAESEIFIGLLEDLGAPHEHLEALKDKGKREVIERAMNILKRWRDVNGSGNQEVMLSLALETIKYTPSDNDFFRIPDWQKQWLDKNEIQAFLLPQLTSRHCTELNDATMDFRKEYALATTILSSRNRDAWIDNIIQENRTALFDSHQMIEDWWAEQNCSNYEKRCRLQRAADDHKGRTADFDPISYIELWKLVQYAREQHLSDKLGRVLDTLIMDEETSQTLQTDKDFYKELCQWKAGHTGTCQRGDFFDACMDAGLESAIDQLQKYSDSTRAVTTDDLEHTLWHIAESERIIELLEDLGAPHEHLEALKDQGKREVIERAMNILKHWRDVTDSRNQEVTLSLALETIKYTPSDNDFFRIPDCQKQGLDKNEIQAFLSPQLTSRHCTELIDATRDFRKKYRLATTFLSSKKRDVWIDNIIEENRAALFDSHQMIEDWWAEQNCSNYEKRCQLQRAADDHKERTADCDVSKVSDEKWPSAKKLEHIAKLVPESRMGQLCDALRIFYISDDLIDEEKRFKTICRWRDGITQLNKEEKSKILSTALKSIGFGGLMSLPKSRFIYKAELVDMALDLIMEDFRPFADSLGINRTRLTSYRQEFRVSHLDRGTISLVLQLCKMIESISVGNMRPDLCNILENAGYPNVIKRFIFTSEPSYGELFAIATAATQDDEPDCLQRMLELTDEDIPDCNMASVFTLLKIWKERVCPGLIDHRVVLAEGLHKINKTHLVTAVINGRYQSRETSMAFIEDMLDRMDGSRRASLERLLKSSDMTSQWIYDWVADRTKDMEGSIKKEIKDFVTFKNASKWQRDFIDKLVDNGFLDLAREVINIVHVL